MQRVNVTTLLLALSALLALASCGGGGGSATTPVGGGSALNPYHPAVTVPTTESYRDLSTAGDTLSVRWLKNAVETLPAEGSAAGIYQNASLKQWADIIFAGINTQRAQAGLSTLKFEPHLALSAQAHARDMALRNYFAHDTPDGMSNFNRVMALNPPTLEWWAENAAKGQESAEEVVSGWMASQKHHDNMLSSQVEYMGIGVYFDPADQSMPIHVIADFASFDYAPETHTWYSRGDVLR